MHVVSFARYLRCSLLTRLLPSRTPQEPRGSQALRPRTWQQGLSRQALRPRRSPLRACCWPPLSTTECTNVAMAFIVCAILPNHASRWLHPVSPHRDLPMRFRRLSAQNSALRTCSLAECRAASSLRAHGHQQAFSLLGMRRVPQNELQPVIQDRTECRPCFRAPIQLETE